jgi:hypothetical protein
MRDLISPPPAPPQPALVCGPPTYSWPIRESDQQQTVLRRRGVAAHDPSAHVAAADRASAPAAGAWAAAGLAVAVAPEIAWQMICAIAQPPFEWECRRSFLRGTGQPDTPSHHNAVSVCYNKDTCNTRLLRGDRTAQDVVDCRPGCVGVLRQSSLRMGRSGQGRCRNRKRAIRGVLHPTLCAELGRHPLKVSDAVARYDGQGIAGDRVGERTRNTAVFGHERIIRQTTNGITERNEVPVIVRIRGRRNSHPQHFGQPEPFKRTVIGDIIAVAEIRMQHVPPKSGSAQTGAPYHGVVEDRARGRRGVIAAV